MIVVTHTHTLALVLGIILFGMAGNAQNAGAFSIPATTSGGNNPYYDPSTGITRCTIDWIGNIPSSVNLMYVEASISGTSICLNNEGAANPTVIHPGFSAANFQRNFTDLSLIITRFGSIAMPFPRPYADPPNTPFLVLQFRTQPGIPYVININGWLNNIGNVISSASATGTPSGFSIIGNIFKPTAPAYSECTNGFALGTAIPNVTMTKTATTGGPGVCFPGAATEQDFILAGFYQFDNNLYFTPYRVRPSKSNVTEICCGINTQDVALFLAQWVIEPELMTNQEALTADFTGDGYVSVIDKAQIIRCANGLPILPEYFVQGWTPWRFAPFATHHPEALISMTPLTSIPDFIDVLPSGPISPNNSFWGVKRGDLDNSCADCGSSIVSDVPLDRGSGLEDVKTKIKLDVADLSLSEGQETLIPVVTEACRNVSDIILELMFDRSLFEVKSIEAGFLPDEFPLSGIVEVENATAVRFSWFSTEISGINIPDNAVLF
jgi:hypothetical protein